MLSHINENGEVQMVDVAAKQSTLRKATARCLVYLPSEVLEALKDGENLRSAKGNVFQTAVIAGIMAAKKTGELIPLCHPIGLDNCEISIGWTESNEVQINCTATVQAKTGVEMEALVGASMAALTIYDMCKALSHNIIIKETKLMAKTGGKKDFHRNDPNDRPQ